MSEEHAMDTDGNHWIPDKDLDTHYKRLRGSKKKPELKGKAVLRKCKACLFWDEIPHPKLAGATADGTKVTCNQVYAADHKRGGTPEDFQCVNFVHKENRVIVETMKTKMSSGVIRSVARMAAPVHYLLRNKTQIAAIKEAFEWLVSQPRSVLKGVVIPLAASLSKRKPVKLNVKLHKFYKITPDDGEPFDAVAVKSRSDGVEFVPVPESNRGTSFLATPEMFETACEIIAQPQPPIESSVDDEF